MELAFSETHLEGGVEIVYTITPGPGDTFNFVQYHSQLGELKGTGAITQRSIFLSFLSEDGAYSGFETMERIDESHYNLRGALSLNGLPSSVLEAAVRRVAEEV